MYVTGKWLSQVDSIRLDEWLFVLKYAIQGLFYQRGYTDHFFVLVSVIYSSI